MTENNRLYGMRAVEVRVKRRGKSPPGAMVTLHAAHLMSCKVKYIGI